MVGVAADREKELLGAQVGTKHMVPDTAHFPSLLKCASAKINELDG